MSPCDKVAVAGNLNVCLIIAPVDGATFVDLKQFRMQRPTVQLKEHFGDSGAYRQHFVLPLVSQEDERGCCLFRAGNAFIRGCKLLLSPAATDALYFEPTPFIKTDSSPLSKPPTLHLDKPHPIF